MSYKCFSQNHEQIQVIKFLIRLDFSPLLPFAYRQLPVSLIFPLVPSYSMLVDDKSHLPVIAELKICLI